MVLILWGSANAAVDVPLSIDDPEGGKFQALKAKLQHNTGQKLYHIINCVVCERPVYGTIHRDDYFHLKSLNKEFLPDIPSEGAFEYISCPYCGANIFSPVLKQKGWYLTNQGWRKN